MFALKVMAFGDQRDGVGRCQGYLEDPTLSFSPAPERLTPGTGGAAARPLRREEKKWEWV